MSQAIRDLKFEVDVALFMYAKHFGGKLIIRHIYGTARTHRRLRHLSPGMSCCTVGIAVSNYITKTCLYNFDPLNPTFI